MKRYYPEDLQTFEEMRRLAYEAYKPLIDRISGPELAGLADVVQEALSAETHSLHQEAVQLRQEREKRVG